MKPSKIPARLFAFLLAVIGSYSASSQQIAQKYLQETDYLLSLPEGYDKDTAARWPLLIFLHGSGEPGNDIEKVKVNRVRKLLANGRKFPFIVVSPQAKEDEDGWETDHLYHFQQQSKKTYRVNVERQPGIRFSFLKIC